MPNFNPGLVHTPLTPFRADQRIDFDLFDKLIEFHLGHGADALALPMHAGESVSLSDEEQLELIDFTVRQVQGRIPVIAHTSNAGTGMAAENARKAEATGAAAIVATTPYYWTPPADMILEHFTRIGSAVSIPFFVYHAPFEMGGVKLSMDLFLKLMERLENLAGVVDTSLDWQFMINIFSNAQRINHDFQLLTGTEYMVSAGAVGATGMFSSLAGVAPNLLRRLYDTCREEKYFNAREPQEAVAALYQAVKKHGPAGLKSAFRIMGRDCGEPRSPLTPMSENEYEKLAADMREIAALNQEPHGWPNTKDQDRTGLI